MSLLVPLLEQAQRAWPGLPVRAFDASPVEIAELVQARTASFGLTLLLPAPEGLAVQPLVQEPFVLVCPEQHPLAQRASVAWGELQGEALVRISLPSGNSVTIDESLGAVRERLQWRYEVQRTAMALEMVRVGLGLTIVPKLSVRPDAALAVVPIDTPLVTRVLAVVRRRDAVLSEPEQLLKDQAVALIRAVLGS